MQVPPMYPMMAYHQGHPMPMAMHMPMPHMAPGMPAVMAPGMAPMGAAPPLPVAMMQARNSAGSDMATSAPPPG